MTEAPKRKRGRPRGVASKRTRMLQEVGEQALRAGVTPMEVMLDNMRFYYSQAADVLQKIMDAAGNDDPKTAMAAYNEMTRLREMAGASAKEAAPYCHPRLTAVAPMSRDDMAKVQGAAQASKPRSLGKERLLEFSRRYADRKLIEATAVEAPARANGKGNGTTH